MRIEKELHFRFANLPMSSRSSSSFSPFRNSSAICAFVSGLSQLSESRIFPRQLSKRAARYSSVAFGGSARRADRSSSRTASTTAAFCSRVISTCSPRSKAARRSGRCSLANSTETVMVFSVSLVRFAPTRLLACTCFNGYGCEAARSLCPVSSLARASA